MRHVATVAALFVATACVGAEELKKATRVIDGTKTTFPAMTTPEGVKALTGVLESCIFMDDRANQYTADDLKKAQKGNHVRFVFSKPLKVEIMRKKLEVSEAVYADGRFLLLCGKDVVYCSKYAPDKSLSFAKWYRQPLPAD
jgi:hypothetical protein